jgi:hypothetical protein
MGKVPSHNEKKYTSKTAFSSYGKGLYEAVLIPYPIKILFGTILHPKGRLETLIIFSSKIIVRKFSCYTLGNREEFLRKNREEKRPKMDNF